MKKVMIFCLNTLIIFNFCGCASIDTNLKDMVIIQGIGVDKAEDDEQALEVSLQVFDPGKASGSANELSGNLTRVLEGKGKTVYDTVQDMAVIAGGKAFASQNNIIVLGEELAKEDVKKTIDYFFREHETRLNVFIVTAKGKAKDVIKFQYGEMLIPAEEVKNILSLSNYYSVTPSTDVLSVLKPMYTGKGDFCITSVSLQDVGKDEKGGENSAGGGQKSGEEKKKEQKIIPDGVGVFSDNKLKGYLDKDETRGLLWITSSMNKGSIVVEPYELGSVSTEILYTNTKLDISLADNVPHVHIRVNNRLNVNEYNRTNQKELSFADLAAIENKVNEDVKEQINATVKKCIFEYNADIFRLDAHMKKAYPSLYKSVEENWHEYVKNMIFEVDVSTTIIRVGEEAIYR